MSVSVCDMGSPVKREKVALREPSEGGGRN